MNTFFTNMTLGTMVRRKALALLMLFAPVSAFVSAQTLNVKVGEVTYAHMAEQTGDMLFDNGSTLTVQGKTYQLAEVTSVTVNNNRVADNTIAVNYQGAKADRKSVV